MKTSPAPTPERVQSIIEMMEDAGLYTHAQEVQRLSDQRDRCELILKSIMVLAGGRLGADVEKAFEAHLRESCRLDKDTTAGRAPVDSVQDPGL